VIHPKLIAVRLWARPEFVQGAFLPKVESVTSNAGGNRLSGDGRIEFFNGFEVGASVHASRIEGFQRTRYGGWTDGSRTGWGAEIRDRNPLLPVRVTYDRRLRDRRTFYALSGREFTDEDDLSTLRFRAQNSKTLLVLEQVTLKNRASPMGYERTGAEFRHTLRWGKGSSLASAMNYTRRLNGVDARSFSWSESASLRQARDFWTILGSRYGRQSSLSVDGSYVEGVTGVRYRPSAGFDIGVEGLARRTRTGVFAQDYARLGPNGTFAVGLPARTTLTANLSAGYEWRSEGSPDGIFADAIQEPHTVDPAGSFRLDRPFVQFGTLLLAAADGSQLFEEGLDYRLFADGPFIAVFALPGGRMAPGDAVVADYRYRLEGDVGAHALAISYGLTLRRGSWSLYARRMSQQALDEIPPGTFLGIREIDRSTVGLMLDAPVGRATASLLGEYGSERIDATRSRTASTRVGLNVPLYRQLTSVTSAGYQRRFIQGASGFSRVQAEENLSMPMGRYFTVRGTLSYWMWREAGVIQRFTGIGGQIAWKRGAVEGRLTYDRARTWLTSERLEHRLFLDFSRRF
jgi:hypothetical protein